MYFDNLRQSVIKITKKFKMKNFAYFYDSRPPKYFGMSYIKCMYLCGYIVGYNFSSTIPGFK